MRYHDLSVVGYKTNKVKKVTKESLLFSWDKLICNKQFIGPFLLFLLPMIPRSVSFC